MKKKQGLFKNLSYTVLANGTNTLVSMVLVLFVPKVLGVTEYAYWQLYLFYASYVGFFHLGWADGVYLKFGGKEYESLDKQYFNTQFWLLTFAEVILYDFFIFCAGRKQKRGILCFWDVLCIANSTYIFTICSADYK